MIIIVINIVLQLGHKSNKDMLCSLSPNSFINRSLDPLGWFGLPSL